MNRMKHCIVAVLIVSVLVVPLGITGCGGSESQKAKQEEVILCKGASRFIEQALAKQQAETIKPEYYCAGNKK